MYCYGNGAGYGRFIERIGQPLFEPKNVKKHKCSGAARHVKCVETGEVFERISDVADLCPECNRQNILSCILNAIRNGHRALGHRWVSVSDRMYEEYLRNNQRIAQALCSDPDSSLHGSFAAARLDEDEQCNCERCMRQREIFLEERKLTSKGKVVSVPMSA